MFESKILIVEDESKLVELLTRNLEASFAVSVVTSYVALVETLRLPSLPYEIVILDRMMNGEDTMDLIPVLKEKFPQCKIMILSAINTSAEKAMALDLGADDYLSKPYAHEELIARLRALSRRVASELRFGNVTIDTVERVARVGERDINLSNKEFLLLRMFVRHPGKVFNKISLYEDVWHMNADIESNAVETTVNKLRRKLAEVSATAQIRNSRNLGYWLEE